MDKVIERVERGFLVDGRLFDAVPRIKRSKQDRMGMMFFHGMDNPFGNPMGVWELYKDAGPDKVKERCYGIATRKQGARFVKFNRRVHVVPRDAIPRVGVNRMVVDPSKGRNFATIWVRQTKGAHYVFREWPNTRDYIEGVGVMEPWAVADGKRLDGRAGGGQVPLGWGLMDYLDLWAGYEGWPRDWRERLPLFRGESVEGDVGRKLSKIERLTGAGLASGAWFDGVDDGAREWVAQRIIDSRAASEGRVGVENARYTTLQSEFAELGVNFDLAPGNQIATGVNLITDWLSYGERDDRANGAKDFSPVLDGPDLFVCEDCVNTIFSLEVWTGEDGNKGACKDFIDLLRYYAESCPVYDEAMVCGEHGRLSAGRVRRRGGSAY